MFDFTLTELLVIFVVALLVFGPKKLPELGKAFGRGIGEFKRALNGVKENMDAEVYTASEPPATPDQRPEHKNTSTVDMHDSNGKAQDDTSHKDHA